MLVLLLLPQSLAAAIIAFVTVCGTFKHTSTAGLWLLLYYYINRIIPNKYRLYATKHRCAAWCGCVEGWGGEWGWGRCMDVKVYDENRDNSDSENRDNCT